MEDERIMEALGGDKDQHKAKLIVSINAHRGKAEGVSHTRWDIAAPSSWGFVIGLSGSKSMLLPKEAVLAFPSWPWLCCPTHSLKPGLASMKSYGWSDQEANSTIRLWILSQNKSSSSFQFYFIFCLFLCDTLLNLLSLLLQGQVQADS